MTGRDQDGGWYGRTVWQAPEIDGLTFLGRGAGLARGRLVDAVVTGSDAYDLFAEPFPAD